MNNVYVDDSGGDDPRPFLCDLCEEGQSAKLNCSTCKTCFCTRCRRFHDKLCKTGQVTEIEVQQTMGNKTKPAAPVEVVDMLQALLKKQSGEAPQGVTSKETGVREKILSLAVTQASVDADVTDVKSFASVVQQLMQKQTETEKVVNSLHSQVATLQNQNGLLCRDLASLQEKNGRERKEFDALQREVVSLKDKNTIVSQDNQLLRNDVTKLQDHIGTLQGEVDKHQGELLQLKTQTDQSQGQGEITALKNSQAQLQGEVASLKTQQSVLQADVKKVKADQGGMQSNIDKTRNKMQADLMKISTQVAFHARLADDVTPKKDEVIVCGTVHTNVGGGYNSITGIFTAPISGVYCFMANASPFSSEATKSCCARMYVDEKQIAFLYAFGQNNCTAHVSLSVKAGQKVWLKAGNNVSLFYAGWLTSFTGFLVQADL